MLVAESTVRQDAIATRSRGRLNEISRGMCMFRERGKTCPYIAADFRDAQCFLSSVDVQGGGQGNVGNHDAPELDPDWLLAHVAVCHSQATLQPIEKHV